MKGEDKCRMSFQDEVPCFISGSVKGPVTVSYLLHWVDSLLTMLKFRGTLYVNFFFFSVRLIMYWQNSDLRVNIIFRIVLNSFKTYISCQMYLEVTQKA